MKPSDDIGEVILPVVANLPGPEIGAGEQVFGAIAPLQIVGQGMKARRDAVGERVRGNILIDHRAGADEAVTADAHAGADGASAADAHTIFNDRPLHRVVGAHGRFVVQESGSGADEDEVADDGPAGEVHLRHDLNRPADGDFSLQGALVKDDNAIGDVALGADEGLVPAGEAFADGGAGVKDGAATDDRVFTDAELLSPAVVGITQGDAFVDLGVWADFVGIGGHGENVCRHHAAHIVGHALIAVGCLHVNSRLARFQGFSSTVCCTSVELSRLSSISLDPKDFVRIAADPSAFIRDIARTDGHNANLTKEHADGLLAIENRT